ncbi:hypothetical protein SAMN02745751_01118 [Dethiosulfatibacter aminovorans DSM 17477]|uniref:Uncharacterized protein n=1 Tax=Dethiosulfatibacter aminovorans DSM 17477 TaxID=1121476 RepID=A0A1M6E9J5_9FIRM|nr:hypothetical protein SAMN02745751_01118 [Dethiosulfatibacter aminovorans DSM 17477]
MHEHASGERRPLTGHSNEIAVDTKWIVSIGKVTFEINQNTNASRDFEQDFPGTEDTAMKLR